MTATDRLEAPARPGWLKDPTSALTHFIFDFIDYPRPAF